jgi:ribosome maturation factor RimP
MLENKEKIKSLLAPVLEEHRAYLIDVALRNERGGKLVQVFLDTDAGVTIDQCAKISRDLAVRMEQENVFESSYRLEISSPGIDKPLTMLRQYTKNLGRPFKVIYRRDEEKVTMVGLLSSIEDDRLTFTTKKGEAIELRFSQIIESKVELPW